MDSDNPDAGDSRLTTDPDQIEIWARETNAIPVRSGGQLRFVREGRFDERRMERIDWSEFEDEMRRSERVVAFREHDEQNPLQVRHRADAMTHLEGENVEDRLLGGEVVTGTITETATIERTVVEAAEIESEVVDREIVDRTVVDAELLSRECTSCTPTSRSEDEAAGDSLDRYEPAYFLDESADQYAGVEEGQFAAVETAAFDLEVEEAWSVTVEELAEYVVESHVVDVEVGETDSVETVDVGSDVDLSGLHEQLIESNLFEREFHEGESIDADVHAIESDVREDDRIRTTLTRDQTVEREVGMVHRVTADATDSERTSVETAHEEVVASGLAETDRLASAGMATGTVGMATGDSNEGESDEMADSEAVSTAPSDDDEGKTVVDASGEDVGVVAEVSDGMAYVEPHPSVTEKLMARLGWSEAEEADYAVGSDEIAQIGDDEIRLENVE